MEKGCGIAFINSANLGDFISTRYEKDMPDLASRLLAGGVADQIVHLVYPYVFGDEASLESRAGKLSNLAISVEEFAKYGDLADYDIDDIVDILENGGETNYWCVAPSGDFCGKPSLPELPQNLQVELFDPLEGEDNTVSRYWTMRFKNAHE